MINQGGRRFRSSFFGYNRSAVDVEFDRLLNQSGDIEIKQKELEDKVRSLETERNAFTKERTSMVDAVNSMSGQVLDLESGLLSARSENSALHRSLEAQKSETSAMKTRFDHLRERDRDFTMREREFAELQNSVASIMSITKRATDRVFQQAVDSQERITQVAGDAAREVAAIRSDMSGVRQDLNKALDELQDRIDRVDAALTGAVHKLIAVKHSGDLQIDENRPDVLSEVERLLSMRAGDTDNAGGGKGFTVPILGPFGSKFVSDTAQRVSSGSLSHGGNSGYNANGVDVHKAIPSQFDSTQDSMLEARNLLDRGGVTAEEYYAQIDRIRRETMSPNNTYNHQDQDSVMAVPVIADPNSNPGAMPVVLPDQVQIGFSDPDLPSSNAEPAVNLVSGYPAPGGSYQIPPPPVIYPMRAAMPRSQAGRSNVVKQLPKRVTVRAPKRPIRVDIRINNK